MIRPLIKKAFQDDDGAALVEFGLLLPSLLVFLALSVEGGRTFWSYQTTVTGVRDAARYLSRVVPANVCENGGSTAGWDAKLTEIVRTTQDGQSLFPQAVSIDAVTSALSCQSGGFRGGPAAVATVTATLQIGYPFSGLFNLAGVSVETITTSVSDTTRVLGS